MIGLLVFGGFLAACGSSPPGEGAGGVGGDTDTGGTGTGGAPEDNKACADLAEVLCARVESCGPSLVRRHYGDLTACVSIHTRQCDAAASLPGIEAPAIAARADELQLAPCWSIFDEHEQWRYSSPQGALPDGSSCLLRLQCATGWCHHADIDNTCGTCEPQPDPKEVTGIPCNSAGNPPSAFWCDAPSVVCDVDAGTCVPIPTIGDPCVNKWCGGYGLVCEEGICVAPLYAGEACNPQADSCHQLANLVCDPQAKTCQSLPQSGGSCGGFQSDSCDFDEYCLTDPGSDEPGSCHPLRLEGESCDEDAFECVWSLLCVNDECAIHTASNTCGG